MRRARAAMIAIAAAIGGLGGAAISTAARTGVGPWTSPVRKNGSAYAPALWSSSKKAKARRRRRKREQR